MDDRAETGLVLHDDVWNAHLAAEGWEVDDELDGVDVVGDDDEAGLLGLDETNGVVETVSDVDGPFSVLCANQAQGQEPLCTFGGTHLILSLTVSGSLFGGRMNPLLLLLLGLWSVLVEEAEKLGSGVLVQGVVELIDGWWDLEALVKDDLLALEADVFGPFHDMGEVTLGLHRAT